MAKSALPKRVTARGVQFDLTAKAEGITATPNGGGARKVREAATQLSKWYPGLAFFVNGAKYLTEVAAGAKVGAIPAS